MQHASASVRLAAVSLLSTVAWAAAPWQDAPATKDAPASSEAPSTQDAPAAADAPAAPPAGKIIEGPVNVYSWAPDDSAKRVEAKDIDLRKVFEDLGPVATRWYQHAITLSNPWFEGRAPGVRGTDLAAEYLEYWM